MREGFAQYNRPRNRQPPFRSARSIATRTLRCLDAPGGVEASAFPGRRLVRYGVIAGYFTAALKNAFAGRFRWRPSRCAII